MRLRVEFRLAAHRASILVDDIMLRLPAPPSPPTPPGPPPSSPSPPTPPPPPKQAYDFCAVGNTCETPLFCSFNIAPAHTTVRPCPRRSDLVGKTCSALGRPHDGLTRLACVHTHRDNASAAPVYLLATVSASLVVWSATAIVPSRRGPHRRLYRHRFRLARLHAHHLRRHRHRGCRRLHITHCRPRSLDGQRMRLSEPTAFLAPSMALQPACQLLALQTAPLDWLVVLAFLVLASRSKDRVDTAHLLLTIVTCRRLQSATIELVTLAAYECPTASPPLDLPFSRR